MTQARPPFREPPKPLEATIEPPSDRGGVIRTIDPVALAESAQGALDRFGELTACAEVRAWLVMHANRHTGWTRPIRRSRRPGRQAWMRRVAVRRRLRRTTIKHTRTREARPGEDSWALQGQEVSR
jgi:hypothetical protein